MAIRTVVTRGYGNGTFLGTIALVVMRGFIAGAALETWADSASASGSWSDSAVDTGVWSDKALDTGVWTDA